MRRTLLSWSSGKDSAWSLHLLRRNPEYEIVGLLTTFNQAADRVAMHGVRRSLVQAQARAAGIPLWEVDLPWPCSNQDYESAMLETCKKAVASGIECVAFGDLFLTDIRAYREKQLRDTGLQPVFPVWGIPTRGLAEEMIASGLRTKLACSCFQSCPRPPTHAAKMASSIRLCTRGQCSPIRCRLKLARSCRASSSLTRI